MDLTHVYQQKNATARFEWGFEGVQVLAPISDIVVIIDVLSFTTCVDVAMNQGATVFPYRYKDDTAITYAAERNAKLAGKRGAPISLSPGSLSRLEPETRVVLPSPNGATCSFLAKDHNATTIAGCLRNAEAVASYIREHGGTVSVIASGERWPDDTLRPSFEDMVGAGAILSYLTDYELSPEALSAIAVFEMAKPNLQSLLEASASGLELIAKGYREDVLIAAELNTSRLVPVLNQEAAYTAAKAPIR